MMKSLFDEEIWRQSVSLPEYWVSSHGRIMREPHTSARGRRVYGGKKWSGVWDEGRGRVTFMYHRTTWRVARLVCEAFHGPAPFDGAVVMHIDENARNNHASNLMWGTQKENLNAPGYLEYSKGRRRSRHGTFGRDVDPLQ